MIRIFSLIAVLLFPLFASAQQCIQTYNPMNGQPYGPVQCFGSNGWPIQNGQVLVGQQTLTFNGGQVTGCSSRFSISFGGRDGRVDFGTCLSQAQQNGAIRTVYAEQGVRQSQTGAGGVVCNNCTINVGSGGTSAGGTTIVTTKCDEPAKPHLRTYPDGTKVEVCVEYTTTGGILRETAARR